MATSCDHSWTACRSGGSSMELRFGREKNRQERLGFVRRHALRVREVPNEVWSREQADLIDAFFENAQNVALSRSEYLRMHRARGGQDGASLPGGPAGGGKQVPGVAVVETVEDGWNVLVGTDAERIVAEAKRWWPALRPVRRWTRGCMDRRDHRRI